MNKPPAYPYLESVSFDGNIVELTDINGDIHRLHFDAFKDLYNALLEDLWFYMERCGELRQEASEWLAAYEKISDLFYG